MSALIKLDGVEKTYGNGVQVHALRPTDLEVGQGELVVILGPSGSGKSTLLNLVGGLDRPSGGRVIVGGAALDTLTPNALADFRRDKVGFVFQFFNLIPSLTARENVELVAELGSAGGSPGGPGGLTPRQRVDQVLETVGLTGRAGHFPGQLSGGEQQRVAIARALVKDPPLFLCDEPTGALDYETGKAVLGILESLTRDQGRTVLIVTHNSALAAMATRLIRLKDGRVVADEPQSAPKPAAELSW